MRAKLLGIFLLTLLPLCLAQNLSIDDIMWLKESGFSTKEIIAEVQSTRTRLSITEQDVIRLRKSGFSDDFIKKLGPWPFPEEVTLENIIKWTRSGESDANIIKKIQRQKKPCREKRL